MKRNCLVILMFLVLFPVISSCVKEEYDFDKLDLKVNVGGDMLAFPLGRTDSIKISTLLNTEELDILQKYDGAYALRLNDSLGYDISSYLPDLKEKLRIEGKNFDEKYDFQIGNIDKDRFVIPAIDEEKTIKPDFPDIDISKIEIPEIVNETSITPSISGYKPTEEQMSIEDIRVLLSKNPFNLSTSAIAALKALGSDPVPVSIDNAPLSKTEAGLEIDIELPEGVSNIDNIVIGPDAVIEITMELKNPVLSDGSVNPNISFNPSDLFVLSESSPLTLNKPLNASNSYKTTYSYKINGLNIDKSSWTGNTLHLEKTVEMEGNISLSNAMVSKSNIDNINAMGIAVTAVVKNVKITSLDLDFPAITGNVQKSIDMELSSFKLPEQVSRIDTVFFKTGSKIALSISKKEMEKLTGVDVTGDLELSFPDEIIVEGANAENVLIINDISLLGTESKKDINITLLGLDLSECTPDDNGNISLASSIGYKFDYSIGGRVSSKDIPDNPTVDMNISSNLAFDHATIVIEDFSQELTGLNFNFSMEMPSEVAGFGKISIDPIGDPTIRLEIAMPVLPLDYSFSGDGLKMFLPDFFVFKNVPAEYHFDQTDNSITLQAPLPSAISLTIENLSAEAVQHGELYYFESSMSLVGNLLLDGGRVNSSDIMDLKDKTIGVEVIVPEIRPSSISMSSLKFDINENMVLPVEMAGIDQLYSIDSILFEGAELSLNLSLLDLPPLGDSEIGLDFYVDLPDAFIFDDERIDAKNVMHINGIFTPDHKFSIDPIVVRGLIFDGEPLGGVISITDTIKVDGAVRVDNPTVDIEDLSGDNVSVKLVAAISTFTPTELYGKIDYPMDPVVEDLSLNDIPEFLRSDECVLDVENPHIAMTLVSNVGIPIDGVLTITPYIRENINNDGIQLINITIPKCEPGEESHISHYWIGNDPALAPDGYQFIQSDLASLIRRIPDRMEIRLEANTDLTQQHYLNINTDYEIKFNYDLVVPLMFGNDLQISLCDTLGNIPALISETLRSSKIALSGTIENSLPLQLELEIKALDASQNVVPISSSKQTIASCNPDGSAKISDLHIDLSVKETSFNDIAYLVLSFRVTSPNNSGIPITDDSFVRADLKALINGGVTLDLNKKDK